MREIIEKSKNRGTFMAAPTVYCEFLKAEFTR